MIQVRRLQPKDLDYIFQNADSLGYEQKNMAGMLDNMMVVVNNNEISGIGFYFNDDDKCMLNWITIKEGHRRNRLGTMLVKTMLNITEQQGSVQAYMKGTCQEFAEFLGFQKVIDAKQILDINNLYQKIYKVNAADDIFKVSLVDYFKPCSHK